MSSNARNACDYSCGVSSSAVSVCSNARNTRSSASIVHNATCSLIEHYTRCFDNAHTLARTHTRTFLLQHAYQPSI